ncbi:MAG: glutamine amidotransferase [Luteolibacter sp.]|uniref:glutamine amidotransferase n=1 Tax=Luteolibacter sp. TaxID=1962973 RepID=UPI0032672D47
MTLPNLPGLDWHPSLPTPVIWTLAGLAALSAVVFILFARNLRGWAKPLVLVLRFATIAALCAIALNPVATEKAPETQRSAAILLDTSTSMALGTRMTDAAEFAGSSAKAFGTGPLQRYSYGPETKTLGATATPPAPSGHNTLLGNAIRRALDAQPPPASLLITGDGGSDDRNELDAAARLAKARGIPIHVHPVGGNDPVTNTWIAGIRVARSARPQAKVPVQVWVSSRGVSKPLTLRLLNATGTTLASTKVEAADEPVPVSLDFTAGIRAETFKLVLEKPDEDIIAEDNELTFQLEVTSPKIRVLYMEGTHISHPVYSATQTAVWNTMELKTRAWDATGEIETDMLSPITQYSSSKNLFKVRRFLGGGMEYDITHGFPKSRDELFNYDVVICGDVPRGNFTDEEMQWVVDLVTRRGGGFCMIGGYTSFDSGDFDQTPWEKITPVDMVEYGHGYSNKATELLIPEAARTHPIWRIVPDPTENEEIITNHPTFYGYHDIRRAKPGATNIGLHADGGGPLITVQSYGRGRSMAFLSDTNGGWAKDYIHWGEEKSGAHIGSTTELGHGPEILQSTAGMTDADAVPAGMIHPSPYFGQFWVNTVRWLAENSIRRLGEGISGRPADSVARPGAELAISAEITAGVSAEEMPGLPVTARLLLPGSKTQRLKWNRDRREFTGSIKIPAEIDAKNIGLIFECETNTRTISDRVNLPVLSLNPEIEKVEATPDLLRDLAAATGGREVSTPQDAADALRADIDRSEKSDVILLRPAWDRPVFWAALLALLGAEWLIRKLARRVA